MDSIEGGIKRFDCILEKNWSWHPIDTLHITLSETGKKFGSILYAEDYFIISKHFLGFLKKNNFLSDEEVFNVQVDSPIPKNVDKKNIPTYYVINYRKIFGANIDLKTFPYPNPRYCEECGHLQFDDDALFKDIINKTVKKFTIDEKSWNGRDLFKIGKSQILAGGGRLVCTDKFKKVIENDFGTFFDFEPFGVML